MIHWLKPGMRFQMDLSNKSNDTWGTILEINTAEKFTLFEFDDDKKSQNGKKYTYDFNVYEISFGHFTETSINAAKKLSQFNDEMQDLLK